jgi:hypothetical protein
MAPGVAGKTSGYVQVGQEALHNGWGDPRLAREIAGEREGRSVIATDNAATPLKAAPDEAAPAQDASDDAAPSPDAASPTTDDAAPPLAQSGGEFLMNKHQLASKLGLPEKEFTRALRAGAFPACLRVGNQPRWRMSKVAQLMAERAAAADANASADDYRWCDE